MTYRARHMGAFSQSLIGVKLNMMSSRIQCIPGSISSVRMDSIISIIVIAIMPINWRRCVCLEEQDVSRGAVNRAQEESSKARKGCCVSQLRFLTIHRLSPRAAAINARLLVLLQTSSCALFAHQIPLALQVRAVLSFEEP